MSRVLRVSSHFSVQLATRLPGWSAGGLLRCIVLPVCQSVVSFSEVHEHDTHLISSCGQVASILVRHARFHRDVSGDILATMSRGC